jgi:hypothetical protein
VWGEGASDLWGRLEREEDEREAELLEAVRARLRGDEDRAADDGDESLTELAAA